MNFKITKIGQTVPLLQLADDRPCSVVIVNSKEAHDPKVNYAVSLVPFYSCVVPLAEIDPSPTGYYDFDGELDCSKFSANNAIELVSCLEKFFVTKGGEILPGQKDWFAKTDFTSLITFFFTEEKTNALVQKLCEGLYYDDSTLDE